VAATSGLRRLSGGTGQLLLKELSAFGIVGAGCFVLDIGAFQVLYAHLHVGAVTSKLLSSVLAMTVAYFAHRLWSFSHRAHTTVRREYLLFTVINSGTLLLGLTVVALVRYPLGLDGALQLQAANISSIVLGTALRFLGYRRWVFPAHPESPAPVAERSEDQARDAA
jgi:putative flippase GtrA